MHPLPPVRHAAQVTVLVGGDPPHVSAATMAFYMGREWRPEWVGRNGLLKEGKALHESEVRARDDELPPERYGRHLATGVLDPAKAGLDSAELIGQLRPSLPQCKRMRTALGDCHAAELPGAWSQAHADTILQRRDRNASVAQLRERLVEGTDPWGSELARLLRARKPDPLDALLDTGRETWLQLDQRVLVFLLYFTAWVQGEGTSRVHHDAYARTEAMDEQAEKLESTLVSTH